MYPIFHPTFPQLWTTPLPPNQSYAAITRNTANSGRPVNSGISGIIEGFARPSPVGVL